MSEAAGSLPAAKKHASARRWASFAQIALWFVLIYAVETALYGTQFGLELSAQGPVDWAHAMELSGVSFGTSAIASIPLIILAWRQRLDAFAIYRAIPIYIVATALACVVRFALFVPLHNALFGSSYTLASEFRTTFIPEFLALVPVIPIVIAIRTFRTARERELRNAQLEGELTQAQLEALQAQLHPHFLFNTLHCISTLMHRNVDEADEMLVRLCDLLRLTLDRPERAEIPLVEELAILHRYLDIMEMRFPKRLRVQVDLPPEVQRILVPPLLLQPLVENVLRHGLDESQESTDVLISGTTRDGTITLSVADNGRGLTTSLPPRLGIGLENTRRRLKTLYGAAASLRIQSGASGGTEVLMTIPMSSTPA